MVLLSSSFLLPINAHIPGIFTSFLSAKVITDRDSGRSRGFGFVNFSSDDCASAALSAMDGKVKFIAFYLHLYFTEVF